MMRKLLLIFLCVFLPAVHAWAIQPIARFDDIPMRHIEYGTTFYIGIIAFSKPGITSVVVNATPDSGSYSGGEKTATTMTLNTSVVGEEPGWYPSSTPVAGPNGVWEYVFEFSTSEFSANDFVTFSATVTDGDSNTRTTADSNWETLRLFVEGASDVAVTEIWVASGGGSCTIGDSEEPCSSIGNAIDAIETANGDTDYSVIYLGTGSWGFGSGTTNTNHEWLTITRASGTSRSTVKLTTGGSYQDTSYIKLQDITIEGQSPATWIVNKADESGPLYLWLDKCYLTHLSGYHVASARPIANRAHDLWSTNNEYYDVDLAMHRAKLSRNDNIHHIGDDANQNGETVINQRVDDQRPVDDSQHADVLQYHVDGGAPEPRNRILYGLYATDLHCQGLFGRPSSTAGKSAKDIAVVNAFFELRTPITALSAGVGALYGVWDHLYMVNTSFVCTTGVTTRAFVIDDDTSPEPDEFGFTNCYLVGNYFHIWRDNLDGGVGFNDFNYGNDDDNTMSENHYRYSYNTDSCGSGGSNQTHEYSPDTNSPSEDTHCAILLDLSDDETYVDFGKPSGDLIGRITPIVPSDVFGTVRGSLSDVGAIEASSGDSTPPTISSVTIDTTGAQTTIVWDETVVTTGYDNGDCQMTCTNAGSVDLNSISGSDDTRTFTNSVSVYENDTCTLACTAALGLGDDEIEDTAGNDMADVSSQAVTESTYLSYPIDSLSSSNGKAACTLSGAKVTIGQ